MMQNLTQTAAQQIQDGASWQVSCKPVLFDNVDLLSTRTLKPPCIASDTHLKLYLWVRIRVSLSCLASKHWDC